MRIGFGWDATGRQRETAPSVDGEVLTDIEWQVWLDAYRNGWTPTGADEQVRKLREHFSREIP